MWNRDIRSVKQKDREKYERERERDNETEREKYKTEREIMKGDETVKDKKIETKIFQNWSENETENSSNRE